MRIIVVHNAYQQRGGEDSVFDAEVDLLRQHGDEVRTYQRQNDELKSVGRAQAALDTLWSRRTVGEFGALLRDFKPDVVHCHNTFPLISPSLYWVAARRGVPVVQTLHNFRLSCVQAMFLRDGKVCEACLGKTPLSGVIHRCYRGSIAQSAVLATMLATHRLVGTYQHKVTRYVALNDFCRRKFIEIGLPAERIVVKPNFVEVPSFTEVPRQGGLYVGRLSEEKGIGVLAEAMRMLGGSVSIDVVGTGPEEHRLRGCPGVNLVGWASADSVLERMRRAQFLVMPSIWYENFPRTLVEAYACAMPVVASRIGALESLVEHGKTGLSFEAGSSEDLARSLSAINDSPETARAMGQAARSLYLREFTAETNYRRLMTIYSDAVKEVDESR